MKKKLDLSALRVNSFVTGETKNAWTNPWNHYVTDP